MNCLDDMAVSVPHMYIDTGVKNYKHINHVLTACEQHETFYDGIWMHLTEILPVWVNNIKWKHPVAYKQYLGNVEDAQEMRRQFQTHGILPLAGTKVVGFLLYHVQRNTSHPTLQLLYLLIHPDHRRKQHGSNLLKACMDRHLSSAAVIEDSKKEVPKVHQLASHITCSIERYVSLTENVAFYNKNGFEDLSQLPELQRVCGEQDHPENYFSMVWTGSQIS